MNINFQHEISILNWKRFTIDVVCRCAENIFNTKSEKNEDNYKYVFGVWSIRVTFADVKWAQIQPKHTQTVNFCRTGLSTDVCFYFAVLRVCARARASPRSSLQCACCLFCIDIFFLRCSVMCCGAWSQCSCTQTLAAQQCIDSHHFFSLSSSSVSFFHCFFFRVCIFLCVRARSQPKTCGRWDADL